MKKAFTLIEIITVFSLILLVSSLTIPLILNDSKQASEISAWRHTYEDILYTFTSLNIQNQAEQDIELSKKIGCCKNFNDKEEVMIEELKPYLRIVAPFENDKYKIKYLNSDKVEKNQFYYFENFYKTQSDTIVGIKWIGELYDNAPILMLLFDVNGEKEPNQWGKDVFGINVYRKKIEPFGKKIQLKELESDCSKNGRGVYCSYKYLIGAQF